MTTVRAVRWTLALPVRALGWMAVLLGDAGYGLASGLALIANRIEGKKWPKT